MRLFGIFEEETMDCLPTHQPTFQIVGQETGNQQFLRMTSGNCFTILFLAMFICIDLRLFFRMKDEKYFKSTYPLNKIVCQVTTVTESQYFFCKDYNINKPPPPQKKRSYYYMYSQTCIKRSLLGQRKGGLLIQVTSLKRFNSYEIFYDSTRKR